MEIVEFNSIFWFLETNNSKNQLIDHLGVNKTGKNIRKSPLHQLNFGNNATREQLQPQVYNINKNDFRNIVQQLTGSPSRNKPLPRPPLNPSKPQTLVPPPAHYNNSLVRPGQYGQPSPGMLQPMIPGDAI
ncbi:hypothetical protein GOBAR_AA04481 [Gossypium barbadense]|uniref:VQ domain-containing protein n=1 Tax=Gossypium barbadense TaxID=3634 RepID=A0A2P5YKK2_GOSBA|nr:hypothetical protein GOBAR_AA04481 [Gossypium barbadense]